MPAFLLPLALLCSASYAGAAEPLKVITTVPDLAEIVREIGGDLVQVESLLQGTEDPHYLDAVPTYIRKVADADAVCFVGLALESAWLPRVLSRSGNAQVQSGGKGHCETGTAVTTINRPKGAVDRSQGDIHLHGNPHFILSPTALAEASVVISKTLATLRPEQAATFNKNRAAFEERMKGLHAATSEKLKSVAEASKQHPVVIEYHQEFSYFFHAYGIKSFGSIEQKPGVPPSAASLARVAQAAKAASVKLALAAEHTPERHMAKFSELSGIRYRKAPAMVQAKRADADSIEEVQNILADEVVKAVSGAK